MFNLFLLARNWSVEFNHKCFDYDGHSGLDYSLLEAALFPLQYADIEII